MNHVDESKLLDEFGLELKDAIRLYETMLLIRRFDETCLELIGPGRIEGGVHPYFGQEAVAVGVCSVLEASDVISSTHRGHGHTIAKGAHVDRMMAELFGRVDGFCKGLGGSMHIADFDAGMLGANGIVGAGLSIAAGAALASSVRSARNVSVAFVGDGAAGAGALHEVLNISALWNLPVILVVENNGWAVGNRQSEVLASSTIAGLAHPHGVPAIRVDGNDVLAVRTEMQSAVLRARSGLGPTLIEAGTYRMGEHVLSPHRPRPKLVSAEREAELVKWTGRDPITSFAMRLLQAGVLTRQDLDESALRVETILDDSVAFAESSPFPQMSDAVAAFFVEESDAVE